MTQCPAIASPQLCRTGLPVPRQSHLLLLSRPLNHWHGRWHRSHSIGNSRGVCHKDKAGSKFSLPSTHVFGDVNTLGWLSSSCPVWVLSCGQSETKPLLSHINAEERWDECQPSGKTVLHFELTPVRRIFLIHLPSDRADVENEHEVF